MSTHPRDDESNAAPQPTVRQSDHRALNWLLLVPILICLAVPFYNRTEPRLFDIPFFYWFQLAIIPIGVVCTVLVYRAGSTPRIGRGAQR